MNTTERRELLTISRRVLLGMVAVLVLSIPSWPEIKNVVGAVNWWMVERLADWDAGRSSEHDTDSVSERAVRPRLAVSPVATRADSSSHRQDPRVLKREASDQVGPVEVGDWVSTAGEASIEVRLALELCRFADGAGSDLTIPGPSLRPQSTLEAGIPVADLFEENPYGYEPVEEDSASESSSRPLATRVGPSFEPPEAFEYEVVTVGGWNQGDDGLARAPEFQIVPPVECRSFEPMITARVADPPASPRAEESTGPPSHDELGRSDRLDSGCCLRLDGCAGRNDVGPHDRPLNQAGQRLIVPNRGNDDRGFFALLLARNRVEFEDGPAVTEPPRPP